MKELPFSYNLDVKYTQIRAKYPSSTTTAADCTFTSTNVSYIYLILEYVSLFFFFLEKIKKNPTSLSKPFPSHSLPSSLQPSFWIRVSLFNFSLVSPIGKRLLTSFPSPLCQYLPSLLLNIVLLPFLKIIIS